MTENNSNPHTLLTDLISTDDAENDAIEFEPDRLNLIDRAADLLTSRALTPADARP